MKTTDWCGALEREGYDVINKGPGHWRASKGVRVVDFWPTTNRWRDLSLGLQGNGLASMKAHMKRYAR